MNNNLEEIYFKMILDFPSASILGKSEHIIFYIFKKLYNVELGIQFQQKNEIEDEKIVINIFDLNAYLKENLTVFHSEIINSFNLNRYKDFCKTVYKSFNKKFNIHIK